MTELAGKRILVTGGTGALGSRIARQLSEAGAHVVLTGRNGAKLQEFGISNELFTLDLALPGAAESLVNTVTSAGQLDGIVIAHGLVAFGPVSELEVGTLSTLVAVNETSAIELIRAAIPALASAKAAGSDPFIVTISGVIADMPTAGMAAYGASKAGLKAFVSAAQRELRREGIRIVDTRPPHTETGLASRAIAGVAPTMPEGLSPDAVATRIVTAITADEKDVPADAFS